MGRYVLKRILTSAACSRRRLFGKAQPNWTSDVDCSQSVTRIRNGTAEPDLKLAACSWRTEPGEAPPNRRSHVLFAERDGKRGWCRGVGAVTSCSQRVKEGRHRERRSDYDDLSFAKDGIGKVDDSPMWNPSRCSQRKWMTMPGVGGGSNRNWKCFGAEDDGLAG